MVAGVRLLVTPLRRHDLLAISYEYHICLAIRGNANLRQFVRSVDTRSC